MLKIRALRRQHYFKKLKDQQKALLGIKKYNPKPQTEKQNEEELKKMLMSIKKSRLVED